MPSGLLLIGLVLLQHFGRALDFPRPHFSGKEGQSDREFDFGIIGGIHIYIYPHWLAF